MLVSLLSSQVLVEALARHEALPGVAAAACGALRSLTSSVEHPVSVAYHNILTIVTAALSYHLQGHRRSEPEASFLLTAACGVLRNLARSPQAGNLLAIQASSAPVLLHAIVRAATTPPFVGTGELAEASHLAAAVLAMF